MPTTDDYDRSEEARMGQEDKERGRRSTLELLFLIIAGAAIWVGFIWMFIRFASQYRWW